MRILFDQGTPAPLKRFPPEGETTTAAECGWSDLSNGDLKNTPAIPTLPRHYGAGFPMPAANVQDILKE